MESGEENVDHVATEVHGRKESLHEYPVNKKDLALLKKPPYSKTYPFLVFGPLWNLCIS